MAIVSTSGATTYQLLSCGMAPVVCLYGHGSMELTTDKLWEEQGVTTGMVGHNLR